MSQLFHNDFSDYDGSKKTKHVMTYADKFPVSTARLRAPLTTITGMKDLIKKRKLNGESEYFIVHRETNTIEAKRFLRNLELWEVNELMKALKNPSDPVKQRGLKERLDEDPVGVKDRPYTDTLCYTATEGVRLLESGTDVTEQLSGAMRASAVLTSPPVTRSAAAGGTGTSEDDPGSDAEAPQQQIMVNRTQYRTTNFHEQLKTHQEELYIRLRSDLPSYMDRRPVHNCSYMSRRYSRISPGMILSSRRRTSSTVIKGPNGQISRPLWLLCVENRWRATSLSNF